MKLKSLTNGIGKKLATTSMVVGLGLMIALTGCNNNSSASAEPSPTEIAQEPLLNNEGPSGDVVQGASVDVTEAPEATTLPEEVEPTPPLEVEETPATDETESTDEFEFDVDAGYQVYLNRRQEESETGALGHTLSLEAYNKALKMALNHAQGLLDDGTASEVFWNTLEVFPENYPGGYRFEYISAEDGELMARATKNVAQPGE